MTEHTVTVTVPFAIRKRGGRKLVITPDGVEASPAPRARVDSALLKALARGFRWRKMLETGDFATIEEVAASENINPSYVSRVLRMTLLAPEIVEAVLAGRQPEGLTMERAMQPFPPDWKNQTLIMSRENFEVYVVQVPCSELCPCDIVTIDNLSSQKGPKVSETRPGSRTRTSLPSSLQS